MTRKKSSEGDQPDGLTSFPSRKKPAHYPVRQVFNRTSMVFLTVCSQDRRPLFNRSEVHALMRMAWSAADAWRVGKYVIMPDHIHLFCVPGKHEYPALTKWVQYWKAMVSRQWIDLGEQPVWQKSFWDTQLRREESYDEKWHYVRNNPVRAGLCEKPEEWSFQGEMNVLMWHGD
jgi:putative transposase